MDLAINRAERPQAAQASPQGLTRLVQRVLGAIEGWLVHPLDFGIRLLLANVFFAAGMTKIASWSTTLALFENEYAVPLLPPELAAYLGTGAELLFPVLLVLGLGTRFAALGLFVLNVVAAISYPDLSEVGLKDHQYWGLLLLVTALHGPGKLSLDHVLRRRFLG